MDSDDLLALLRCYAAGRERTAARLTIQYTDGESESLLVPPAPRKAPRARRLPPSVRDLLAVLDEGGRRLPAGQLVAALTDPPTDRRGESKRTAWGESTAWRALAYAVRLDLVREGDDGKGRGYGLAAWDTRDNAEG